MQKQKKSKFALFLPNQTPRLYVNQRPEPQGGTVVEITASDERRLAGHPLHTWYLHEGEIRVRPEQKPRPVIRLQTRAVPESVELKPPAPIKLPTFWQRNRASIVSALIAIGVSVALKYL